MPEWQTAVYQTLTINAAAFTGEGNLIRKATGYDQKKLKPRYPASGSRAARAELPAAIRAYQRPTDSSEEALTNMSGLEQIAVHS